MIDFDKALQDLLEEFPEMRRKLHEELGELTKQEVDRQITVSGVHDYNGKVRKWQVKAIGSGGGYAAVRPEKTDRQKIQESVSRKKVDDNSPGAITRYLNEGHRRRRPAGGKGYRKRVRVEFISGYHFYGRAWAAMEARAIRVAERFLDEIVQRLEGG